MELCNSLARSPCAQQPLLTAKAASLLPELVPEAVGEFSPPWNQGHGPKGCHL